MKLRTALLLLALVSLTIAACQRQPEGESGNEAGEVLFQDDFSDPESGWNRVSQESGVTDYADGAYRILVNAVNTDVWSRPGLAFDDVHVEVDSYKVAGDRDNRFGIVCRVNDNNQFYIFMISSDGYYGIGKIKGSQSELIGMEAMLPSEKIEQGSAFNHIEAECAGDQLTLWVNGEKLAEAQDSEFKTGDVGLIAGTYHTAGTDIRFDHFKVTEP